MNVFRYLKKGIPIQYNDFIAVTPNPGLKFTNWYGRNFDFFFWHVVFGFGYLLALAVNLKFWYQYQFLGHLTAYGDLEQGVEQAFPSIYLCARHPLDPNKLAKYRENFLQPNSTMSAEAIDSSLQHIFRTQGAAFNVPTQYSDALENNVNMIWLDENMDKLFYKVEDQLKDCSFQGVHRECKDIFKSLETPLGQCVVFNSIFTGKRLHEDPHQVWYANISEFDEDWSLRFKIFGGSGSFVLMYYKPPKNLLALNDYHTNVWHPAKQINGYRFSILDHLYEENFRTLALRYRQCYFHDEAFFKPDLKAEFNSNFYDAGVCFAHCHARQFMELCGCWPCFAKSLFPKMVNKSKICGLKDMECHEKNYLAVRRMRCSECLNNCNGAFYVVRPRYADLQEPEIINHPNLNSSLEVNYYELNIRLEGWFPIRFRIINIFCTTEFILVLASTTCLFLGRSILTFMETFYNLFIRFPLFYFINWEYFITTARGQEELAQKKIVPCINMRLKPGMPKN